MKNKLYKVSEYKGVDYTCNILEGSIITTLPTDKIIKHICENRITSQVKLTKYGVLEVILDLSDGDWDDYNYGKFVIEDYSVERELAKLEEQYRRDKERIMEEKPSEELWDLIG